MQEVSDKISLTDLSEMASTMYGNLVKAVVDIKRNKMVVDAELHVDQEQYLLEEGSAQQDLWGINLYPDQYGTEDFLEQMGNIGSEVGRTLKLKRKGSSYEAALIRALDLFDATVEHLLQTKPYRIKEVLRSKDQFLQSVLIKDDPSIEKYFMQFAIAARRKVG